MPCKFCSSASHTLAKCNSPLVIDVVNTVTALINSSPFKLREQVDLLKGFSAVQLSVVCRSIYGLPAQGNKNQSIGYIIGHYFGHLGLTSDAAIQTLSLQNTDIINQEYDKLVAWLAPENDTDLRSRLLADMDIYYARRYGLRRYEFPIAVFYEGLQYLQAQRTVTVNPHIDKLLITVTVEPELPTEECCICLNDKQMSQFNCGHSCCPECITKVAQKRTNLFISCPLCRAKIQNIQVIDQDVRNLMNLEINAC